MEKCPNCGYKRGSRLPFALIQVCFLVVYLIWMLGDYQPRQYRFIGISAFVVFSAANVWIAVRSKPTVAASAAMMRKGNND
jgi:hypothetical protein